MTVSCIEEFFKKYVRQAKADDLNLFREDNYLPHSMRHSTASHMLEVYVQSLFQVSLPGCIPGIFSGVYSGYR